MRGQDLWVSIVVLSLRVTEADVNGSAFGSATED